MIIMMFESVMTACQYWYNHDQVSEYDIASYDTTI